MYLKTLILKGNFIYLLIELPKKAKYLKIHFHLMGNEASYLCDRKHIQGLNFISLGMPILLKNYCYENKNKCFYFFVTLKSVCFQPKEEFEMTPTVEGTLPLPPLISLPSFPRSKISDQNVSDSSLVKIT